MSKGLLDIFMHILKTGGTTLNELFNKQYQLNEIFDHDSFQYKMMKMDQLKAGEKRNIKAVTGHYFYGIHQEFSRPFNYFSDVTRTGGQSHFILLFFEGLSRI
ncbi:hypothetical protein ACFQ9Y_09920 [Peribacillus simplex]|uniref:hypothetical protein n=1 Tax=Peribacillus simplex TaxID=1478 RepID=UPI0036709C65